jgi:outer membrane protein OmpA-like peptidoglycan-associated protein
MNVRFLKCTGVLLAALLALGSLAWAQEEDAENCKDHPMFSRMKGFYINACESDFDAVEFYLADSEVKTIEGDKTVINYSLREGSPKPSVLQVRRNYANAIKSLGGEILLDEYITLTARLVKSGKEYWISVAVYNDGNDYTLTVLEIAAMVQEVTANEMLDALNKDGFIALYINFDTGKSDIKPESQPIVAQIAELLKANPDLKVSIEGHTDNVGTPAANKTLSESRAKSVLNAVAALGVPAARMGSVGWGQERPVADNRSEEGRAKNRRVEIVKK